MNSEVYLLISALAFVTYLTRVGGHIILSRFKHINPRVEAALEAVPAAVLTTIAIPPALTNGAAEFLAMAVAVIACLRLPSLAVIILGVAVLVAGRQVGL